MRERPSAAQLAYLARQDAWRSGSRGRVVRNPYAGPRRMVEHRLELLHGEWILQLPLYILPLNDNGTQWTRGDSGDSTKKQRKMLWDCCRTQLRGMNYRVSAISFERLSTDAKGLDAHDNLRSAFKPLCDAFCAWIVEGPNVVNPRVLRKIGSYDDIVLRTWRVPCEYSQRQHTSHGIRIGLQLGASREPTQKP